MPKDRYLQAVRGAAITAVVFIHCLPQCDVSVALRPLLNWAVAAFLFLSGLLTTEASVARGGGTRAQALADSAAVRGLESNVCPAPAGLWHMGRPQGASHRGRCGADVFHRGLSAADDAHLSSVPATQVAPLDRLCCHPVEPGGI